MRSRARYTATLEPDHSVIVVVDQWDARGPTVTNDAEAVVLDLAAAALRSLIARVTR